MLDGSIKPVAYQSFLNINDNTELNRFGLHNGAPNDPNDLYEKWENLAVVPVGDREAPDDHFLFVGSDNDFITQQGFMAGEPYQDASGNNVDTRAGLSRDLADLCQAAAVRLLRSASFRWFRALIAAMHTVRSTGSVSEKC
ncbi:MAG: hypothetical protein ACJ8AH_14165 [Stellaceae bacterium]